MFCHLHQSTSCESCGAVPRKGEEFRQHEHLNTHLITHPSTRHKHYYLWGYRTVNTAQLFQSKVAVILAVGENGHQQLNIYEQGWQRTTDLILCSYFPDSVDYLPHCKQKYLHVLSSATVMLLSTSLAVHNTCSLTLDVYACVGIRNKEQPMKSQHVHSDREPVLLGNRCT